MMLGVRIMISKQILGFFAVGLFSICPMHAQTQEVKKSACKTVIFKAYNGTQIAGGLLLFIASLSYFANQKKDLFVHFIGLMVIGGSFIYNGFTNLKYSNVKKTLDSNKKSLFQADRCLQSLCRIAEIALGSCFLFDGVTSYKGSREHIAFASTIGAPLLINGIYGMKHLFTQG